MAQGRFFHPVRSGMSQSVRKRPNARRYVVVGGVSMVCRQGLVQWATLLWGSQQILGGF